MHITVREMLPSDADAVSGLMPDLGYEASPAHILQRLQEAKTHRQNGLLVAEDGKDIVGWCHVHSVCTLQNGGYVEVQGIVVSAAYQGKGVGSIMLRHAESWAAEHGYSRVRLRSGMHREDAHAFYEARGYAKSRASYAFEKFIDQA